MFYTIPPLPVGSIRTTYWSVNRPTFRVTPQTVEAYWNRNILIGRYGTTTGRTLIVKDGDVQFVESPLDVTLNAADWYVLGGHDQTISESQAQDLIDAGYGALVENA